MYFTILCCAHANQAFIYAKIVVYLRKLCLNICDEVTCFNMLVYGEYISAFNVNALLPYTDDIFKYYIESNFLEIIFWVYISKTRLVFIFNYDGEIEQQDSFKLDFSLIDCVY